MQKTTKNLEIRHHKQTIGRIKILIEQKAIRKNIGSVLIALANFADKCGQCFPSQDTLAEITGYRRETISRLTDKLATHNWLTKTNNRKNLFIGGKYYFPRTIYKINIAAITKKLKAIFEAGKKKKLLHEALEQQAKAKAFKQKQAAKEQAVEVIKSDKSDHSAPLKAVTQSLKRLKDIKNTALRASPNSGFPSVDEITSDADQHEEAHQKKVRHTASKRNGLKNWQVQNGKAKSTQTVNRERKASSILKRARDLVKPLLDRITALHTKLMTWHPTVNPTAFSKADHEALKAVQDEIKANHVRLPVNVMADYKLSQYVKMAC